MDLYLFIYTNVFTSPLFMLVKIVVWGPFNMYFAISIYHRLCKHKYYNL